MNNLPQYLPPAWKLRGLQSDGIQSAIAIQSAFALMAIALRDKPANQNAGGVLVPETIVSEIKNTAWNRMIKYRLGKTGRLRKPMRSKDFDHWLEFYLGFGGDATLIPK